MGLNIAPGGQMFPVDDIFMDKMWNKEYGINPFLKRNRNKPMGNEFTSESAKNLALKRSECKSLPSQILAELGKHHWQTAEYSAKISKLNSINFKDSVTVTDKTGRNMRISKTEFYNQQIGDRCDWEFVGAASKEAKLRRGK